VDTGQTSNLPRGVTAEDAAANPRVQQIIAPRIVKVRQISELFLNVIVGSLDIVPYGIRWISKQIRKLTKAKFPDASPFAVGSLIGSFFMLRFINPAVVTPSAYMLVEQQLSPNARKTTTLVPPFFSLSLSQPFIVYFDALHSYPFTKIAKMLQNLTNKPNYAKEQFMIPLNAFVEENKERMTKFFNDLCEVDDFHEQLEVSLFLSLTKILIPR